jgi:hypothetical protein
MAEPATRRNNKPVEKYLIVIDNLVFGFIFSKVCFIVEAGDAFFLERAKMTGLPSTMPKEHNRLNF